MSCLATAVLLKSGRVQSHQERLQSREEWHSHCTKWALYYISIDRETELATSTRSSVFCIGRNLSCSSEREGRNSCTVAWNPFSHGLRLKLHSLRQGQSEGRNTHLRGKPCTTSPSWPRPKTLAPTGKLWLIYKQTVYLGNPVEQGSFISGKNEGGFLFNTPRWFLSKYLECYTTVFSVEKSWF